MCMRLTCTDNKCCLKHHHWFYLVKPRVPSTYAYTDKKCGLVSDSLGKNYNCSQASNDKSSIYIQSNTAAGWAPSYWAFGCGKAPAEQPNPEVTFKSPLKPGTPILGTPTVPEKLTSGPDCTTDGTRRGHCVLIEYCQKLDTALGVMIFHNFVERYGCGQVTDGNFGVCCPID
ncbi:uncharacterized protein LOC134788714 [Penaeus indicus]|uniref:uncharacterized protein LOC134788714 n=1 Tax=Penaeus indicus TaxID=29960 RepID=UPI00300D1BD6